MFIPRKSFFIASPCIHSARLPIPLSLSLLSAFLLPPSHRCLLSANCVNEQLEKWRKASMLPTLGSSRPSWGERRHTGPPWPRRCPWDLGKAPSGQAQPVGSWGTNDTFVHTRKGVFPLGRSGPDQATEAGERAACRWLCREARAPPQDTERAAPPTVDPDSRHV